MTDYPKRKQIRLETCDYSTPGAYFITICTANRKPIFWATVGAAISRPNRLPLSTVGQVIAQGIEQIPLHYPDISIESTALCLIMSI